MFEKLSQPVAEVFRSRRPEGQTSIVREWVANQPARVQGVLLTAIRGCDTSPREDNVKTLARCYRATVIHGLNDDPKTFLLLVDYDHDRHRLDLLRLMKAVAKDHDAIPHHYLMHLIHAAEIVGYFHPHEGCRVLWCGFYLDMCRKMHMHPELEQDLMDRLCVADEAAFAAAQ